MDFTADELKTLRWVIDAESKAIDIHIANCRNMRTEPSVTVVVWKQKVDALSKRIEQQKPKG